MHTVMMLHVPLYLGNVLHSQANIPFSKKTENVSGLSFRKNSGLLS